MQNKRAASKTEAALFIYSFGGGGRSSGTGIGRIRDSVLEAEELLPAAIAVFGVGCDLTVTDGRVVVERRVGLVLIAGVRGFASIFFAVACLTTIGCNSL